MTSKFPPIKLNVADGWHTDQCFVNGDEAWDVRTLWDAAKSLPAYEVPLVGMNIDLDPWGDVGSDFLTFVAHAKLVQDANMKHPIILTPEGVIADGRHRIAKAILLGHTTIKVKRLTFMPEADYECNDAGEMLSAVRDLEEE